MTAYLRLNGVNAREHPVFQELSRVKQYFDKIKNAEFPPEKGNNQTLDKKAAARFIKAGLVRDILNFMSWPMMLNVVQSGNDKYDLARAEQQAKERARAQIIGEGLSKKRDIEQVDKAGEEHGESDSDSSSVEEQGDESKPKKPKRRKIDTTSAQESTQESTEGHPSLTGISKRASRKARRAQERRDRKEAKEAAKKAARDYVEETSNEIAKEAGA